MREVEGTYFSHTYQERYWAPALSGIRYPLGNLSDLLNLLRRDPLTRQGYLPIWFPEDTGATHGGRVPCSLGYLFLVRNGEMNVFYTIRSCDLLRHFRDDVFLTCRLLLWVLDELRKNPLDPVHPDRASYSWKDITPGYLIMSMHSLHCFVGDIPVIKYRRSIGLG